MNMVAVTGYLLKDADERYTQSGHKKLSCDVMVACQEGVSVPWRCEFEEADLIERCDGLLTAGRAVVLSAILSGRIYEERGVQKGWTRFLKVLAAEFPARTQPKVEVTK